ncbi:OmpA family protein [Undibacterium seohonense]|jgi:OOP family OmpA-OmpF porin|uniref:OmpA family protein n=1 Tax=Undibacterium seohonense TaxID=1344950 RepID=A0ABR6X2H8_9BURK|nr:OmpA family protein [Undibacterium seohonense]MBC3806549.1 OmpA family protein [Undibacterium seohonense]
MKQNKKVGLLGLVTCALLFSTQANAQMFDQDSQTKEWSKSAWYIGAGLGQSRTSIDEQRLVRSLMDNGANSVMFTKDERDLGYKLFLGKQLNENFAIEGGYFNLGESSFSALGNPGTLHGRVGFQGVNLDLLGRVNFTERFAFLANIGMHYTEAKAHFNGDRLYAVSDPNPSERKLNGKYGLGLEYQLTEALAVRGQIERHRVNDGVQNRGDVDLYSISLVYKMGQPAPQTRPAYVAPEPMPAPAPAPLVITETRPVQEVAKPRPVPVSEKINFSAEALFDFDKSIVKPEGKAALDQMLDSLKNMNTEVMVTVGHTDSIGSDEYNQALSIRRAEAVKAHLISRGVGADRVYTEGQGERQAIADNSTSEGRAKNRRVIVEVVGSRR